MARNIFEPCNARIVRLYYITRDGYNQGQKRPAKHPSYPDSAFRLVDRLGEAIHLCSKRDQRFTFTLVLLYIQFDSFF